MGTGSPFLPERRIWFPTVAIRITFDQDVEPGRMGGMQAEVGREAGAETRLKITVYADYL